MINSPIFGMCEEPDGYGQELIKRMVDTYPVHTFAAINKKLNSYGFCISISTLEENNDIDIERRRAETQ